jgi:protein gp37
MRTSAGNWNQIRRWNRQAPESQFAGQKGFWPVFCASLADIFDNEVDPDWRTDFWTLVKECNNLTFLVLTKRIGNAAKMLPPDWGKGYPNVWIGATVVNQEEADRDVPRLLAVPAGKRFLSMEPLLGPVDLVIPAWLEKCDCMGTPKPGVDWVIVGGESRDAARPMHPEWVLDLRRQCEMADVPFLFKQWGEWRPAPEIAEASGSLFHRFEDGAWAQKDGTNNTGCALAGEEIKQWPLAA